MTWNDHTLPSRCPIPISQSPSQCPLAPASSSRALATDHSPSAVPLPQTATDSWLKIPGVSHLETMARDARESKKITSKMLGQTMKKWGVTWLYHWNIWVYMYMYIYIYCTQTNPYGPPIDPTYQWMRMVGKFRITRQQDFHRFPCAFMFLALRDDYEKETAATHSNFLCECGFV